MAVRQYVNKGSRCRRSAAHNTHRNFLDSQAMVEHNWNMKNILNKHIEKDEYVDSLLRPKKWTNVTKIVMGKGGNALDSRKTNARRP